MSVLAKGLVQKSINILNRRLDCLEDALRYRRGMFSPEQIIGLEMDYIWTCGKLDRLMDTAAEILIYQAEQDAAMADLAPEYISTIPVQLLEL